MSGHFDDVVADECGNCWHGRPAAEPSHRLCACDQITVHTRGWCRLYSAGAPLPKDAPPDRLQIGPLDV